MEGVPLDMKGRAGTMMNEREETRVSSVLVG